MVAVFIVTALFFDLTNVFHDSPNAVATSGALRPGTAVVLNVVGAFLSTEVAKKISGEMVNDAIVTASSRHYRPE